MRLTTPAWNSFTPNLNFTRLAIVLSAPVLLFNFAPSAVADTVTTYDIIFTTIEGPGPTAGSFTYDSTTPRFSDFTVVYNGVIFDFTADANHPNNHAPSGICSPADPNTGWLIISHSCDISSSVDYWGVSPCCGIDSVFSFLDSNNAEGAAIDAEVIPPQPTETSENATSQGSWALSPRSSPTSVPEPGTRVLLAAALAGAIFARKRIVPGVRPANRMVTDYTLKCYIPAAGGTSGDMRRSM
jgi:hypothetical protein